MVIIERRHDTCIKSCTNHLAKTIVSRCLTKIIEILCIGWRHTRLQETELNNTCRHILLDHQHQLVAQLVGGWFGSGHTGAAAELLLNDINDVGGRLAKHIQALILRHIPALVVRLKLLEGNTADAGDLFVHQFIEGTSIYEGSLEVVGLGQGKIVTAVGDFVDGQLFLALQLGSRETGIACNLGQQPHTRRRVGALVI